jgi:hypothetical protein
MDYLDKQTFVSTPYCGINVLTAIQVMALFFTFIF